MFVFVDVGDFFRRERVGESEAPRSPRDVAQPRSTLAEWSSWIVAKEANLQDVRRARAVQALLPVFINGQLHCFVLISVVTFCPGDLPVVEGCCPPSPLGILLILFALAVSMGFLQLLVGAC